MRKLLDAGVDTFARRGYHAARVDDIVKRAKMSHGTFYLYFANKEELFLALTQEVADDLVALVDDFPAIERGDDGYDALRAWLSRLVDVYEQYGPVLRAWTEIEIGASELGRLGTDVWTEFARALFAQIQRSAADDLDPQIASIAIVAMIERFNYYVLARQVEISRDEMLDTLASVTHSGLFAG
jgi:AcrR family transcriptional regulator